MSVWCLFPWILSGIIVAMFQSMIIGSFDRRSEKDQLFTHVITWIAVFTIMIIGGTGHSLQMIERDLESESRIICHQAERVHLINSLEKIEKIQINNNSDHIDYTRRSLNDLKDASDFWLSVEIDQAKQSIKFIEDNPWMLR